MAAVVIYPARSRTLPKTDLLMAADGCFEEPIREQRPAEARRPIKVPLSYYQDRHWPRFLEGCPANHAVLSPGAGPGWHFRPLPRIMLGLRPLSAAASTGIL